MPCYSPLQAWRGNRLPSGKWSIVFKRSQAERSWRGKELSLPCGRCIGCRLEYSRQWAMRCLDEASMYKKNCFITLTYDEVQLPEDGGLESPESTGGHGAFQLFMKRLRKEYGQGIRYYHCGEYGDLFGRPHYHALLFNFDFPDRVYHHRNSNGDAFFSSKALDALWGKGITLVGDVTFETAAYVARYVLKKIVGDESDEHYVDKDSGFIRPREYVTMSRRPGIGRSWFEKFKSDCFPSDFRVVNGVKVLPPKYYGSLYELDNPKGFARIKQAREDRAQRMASDNTLARLAVKEEVKKAQIKNLKRSFENG